MLAGKAEEIHLDVNAFLFVEFVHGWHVKLYGNVQTGRHCIVDIPLILPRLRTGLPNRLLFLIYAMRLR